MATKKRRRNAGLSQKARDELALREQLFDTLLALFTGVPAIVGAFQGLRASAPTTLPEAPVQTGG